MNIIKKAFVLVLVLMSCVIMQAQDSRLSIGFAGSIDFVSHPGATPNFAYYNYVPYTGRSVGQMMQYYIGKRNFVQFGIYHSRSSHFISFYGQQYHSDSVQLIPYDARVELDYVSLPLFLGYRVWEKGKWALTPSIGTNLRVLANAKSEVHYEDKQIPDYFPAPYYPDYSPIQLGVQVNLGIEYNLTDGIFILLQPFFRYETLELGSTIIGTTPKHYGANLSINFRL